MHAKSILFSIALMTFLAPVMAREKQMHGHGPEGEEVVLRYDLVGEHCHRGEFLATGTWPDGTARTGCWTIYYPSYRVTVRWRQEVDGRPVEWTSEYQGLALRYVARQ